MIPNTSLTAFSKPVVKKLCPGGLTSFQDEVYTTWASVIPNLKDIIFGESKAKYYEKPISLIPTPYDAVYLPDDDTQSNPIYLYCTVATDGTKVLSNPLAYMAAVALYDTKAAKTKLLLGNFVSYTILNISDISKSMMESTAGGPEGWRLANTDASLLWDLIRSSHKLVSNNELLVVLRDFIGTHSLGDSIYDFNKQSAERKSKFESAFASYMDEPVAELVNALSSFMYVDSFVNVGVIPIATHGFLNGQKDSLCPPFAEVVASFTSQYNNSVGPMAIGNVAKVNQTSSSTHECRTCHLLVACKRDRNGILYPDCPTCHQLVLIQQGNDRKKKEQMVTVIKGPGPGITIIPSKPKPAITVPLVIPKKKPGVVPSAAVVAPRPVVAPKPVSFNSVVEQFGFTSEQATSILESALMASQAGDSE
jgi:ribosomal protein L37AE/L43A